MTATVWWTVFICIIITVLGGLIFIYLYFGNTYKMKLLCIHCWADDFDYFGELAACNLNLVFFLILSNWVCFGCKFLCEKSTLHRLHHRQLDHAKRYSISYHKFRNTPFDIFKHLSFDLEWLAKIYFLRILWTFLFISYVMLMGWTTNNQS